MKSKKKVKCYGGFDGFVTKEYSLMLSTKDCDEEYRYICHGVMKKHFRDILCFPKLNKIVTIFHKTLLVLDLETSKFEEIYLSPKIGGFLKWDDKRFITCSSPFGMGGKLKIYSIHRPISIVEKSFEIHCEGLTGLLKLDDDKVIVFRYCDDVVFSISEGKVIKRYRYPDVSNYNKRDISPILSPSKKNFYYVVASCYLMPLGHSYGYETNEIFCRNWKTRNQVLTGSLGTQRRFKKYCVFYSERMKKEFLVRYGSAYEFDGKFDGEIQFFDSTSEKNAPTLVRVVNTEYAIPFDMLVFQGKYLFAKVSDLTSILNPKKGLLILDPEEILDERHTIKVNDVPEMKDQNNIDRITVESSITPLVIRNEEQSNILIGNDYSCLSLYSIDGNTVDIFIGIHTNESELSKKETLRIIRRCRITGLQKLKNFELEDLLTRSEFLKNEILRSDQILGNQHLTSFHFLGIVHNTAGVSIPKIFLL